MIANYSGTGSSGCGGVEPDFAFRQPFLLKLLHVGQVFFALAAKTGFLDAQTGEIAVRALEDVSGASGM